jgi:hypothetical protein
MRTTARRTIVQAFPIANDSDRDWKFKVRCSHEGTEIRAKVGGVSVKDFTVKKGLTLPFEVHFSPAWICNISTKLLL